MTPGQMCNKLLHDFFGRECLGKGTLYFRFRGERPSFGKIAPKVCCQPIDHASSPSLRRLAGKDVAADAPIEENQFPVDGNSRLEPSRGHRF